MARARLTATVSRASDVYLEGFDEVHPTLYGVRDLPRPTMTHMRLQRVADGIINLHGRTHDAAVTRTRQVSTSVEPIRCRPIEPEGTRRSAGEPVAGRRMPGETTA